MHDEEPTPACRPSGGPLVPQSPAEPDRAALDRGPRDSARPVSQRPSAHPDATPGAAEQVIRAAVARGEIDAAAAAAIALYGAEIFGFLIGVLDHVGAAHDAYATFSARLSGHLARATWTCSLRVMMYVIACRTLARHTRGGAAAENDAPAAPDGASLVAPTPLVADRFQRIDSMTGISALRRNLSQGERELLVLRVDRGLGWSDIAIISLGESAAPIDIQRESKRLEKRFRTIREQLARSAIELGLLPV